MFNNTYINYGEKNMNYFKKNLANTITVLASYRENQKNYFDPLIDAFDFSCKYEKHFARKSFVNALAKKSEQVKNTISKTSYDLRNKAKEIYNA